MASWDIALLVVAGYLAAVTLVKLMIRRRDRAVARLRKVMKRELARTQAERRDKAA